MKKIVGFCVALLCAMSLHAKGDLHLFEIENKNGAITPEVIEKALTSNGFSLGINSEMNYPFQKQFGQSDYKIFNLLTLYHTKLATALVNKYPQAGVFTPMGVGIYQAKNEDAIHISIVSSEAHAKILGFEDAILKDIEADMIKAIKTAFPKAKHTHSKTALKETRALVTQYELEIDGDDWESAKEDFEMSLESGFEPFGFVMPSYMNFNNQITKNEEESNFDFYSNYSICKLEVIYTVAKTRPEAAAFAPCTTMLYKKKGEDKIVVGFPAVYNWMSSALVEHEDATAVLLKAQKDFESILKNITE